MRNRTFRTYLEELRISFGLLRHVLPKQSELWLPSWKVQTGFRTFKLCGHNAAMYLMRCSLLPLALFLTELAS